MGAFLDKPKTEKYNESGSGNGLRYGLSSMQGWRVEMEDAHAAVIGLSQGLRDWSFFAVFDGHAGGKVSGLCSELLLQEIVTSEDFNTRTDGEDSAPPLQSVKMAIKSGFLSLDEKMRQLPEVQSGEDKSGSTAVCVLVSPQHLCFGNSGDSRAVMSREGNVSFFTIDHKPVNPEEKERIIQAGGSVMIQRVNGSLAVSRALGDFEYKNVEGKGPCEQLVSPEPEIFVVDRSENDEFVVLACDGIWDVMSNEELCDFVRSRMQLTNDLKSVCNQVVDTCLFKGSRDNMSIVIITFEGSPKVSEEALNREAELEARLEAKVQDFESIIVSMQPQHRGEILDQADPGDAILPYVMHLLANEDIEGLPPGGGLSSKRATVEAILNRLHPQNPDSSAS